MSENPEALAILKKNPNKIKWANLCLNENPEALELLEDNVDKIDWRMLSRNPLGVDLISKNLSKLYYECWSELSTNPGIFEIDYEVLKKRMEPLREDLMKACFHPQRLRYYLENYDYDIGDEEYLFK